MNGNIHLLSSIPILNLSLDDDVITKDESDLLKTIQMVDDKIDTVSVSKSENILNELGLIRIKRSIDDAILYYTKNILNINNKFKMTHSWLTKNKKNQKHHKHNHPNTIISAVVYFNDDYNKKDVSAISFECPGLKNGLNNFQFAYNILKWTEINAKNWTILPKTNSVIIFPAWLEHYTQVNESETTRYCLGTNYFINDQIDCGSYSSFIDIKV